MATATSIGVIELSSIGIGYLIEDQMLKAASVQVLIARTICSGKYMIVVGGSVSDVETAVQAGLAGAGEAIIDHWICPNVHESVFPALGQSVTLSAGEADALGVVETFSGASVIAAADAAAKAARVTIFRIHVAMALGGKGLCLMTGTVADVRSGVQVAAAEARRRGLLVSEIVIPRPSPELFGDYLQMKRLLHVFGRLLVLAVFLGAAWLLYQRLKTYTPAQILAALSGIAWWHIALASLLTVANYGILVGYDWFAVRWVIGAKLPLRKIAVASFSGYAFSYNFGATLFGASIRYRLYSAWGVSLLKILELLVILGLTFWFGVFTLAGVVFVASPLEIPPQVIEAFQHALHGNVPFRDTFWIGVVLLLIAAGYVMLSILLRKPLRLFGWQVPVPPPKLTLYQIVIACGDLLAAAVMYWLLPSLEGGYVRVLGVFMLAFVAAVLSHVPGGYGVFESVFMFFFPQEAGPAVLAAIIVFRIIYYWIPLVIAAAMLGYHELTLPSGAATQQDFR